MTNKWEEFTKGKKIAIGKPLAKIVGEVNLFINAVWINSYNLNNYEYVNVYTQDNGDKWLIGFEFTNEKKDNSFKLSHAQNQISRVISVSSLFRVLKIDSKKYKEEYFEPKKEKLGDKIIFVIEIKKR